MQVLSLLVGSCLFVKPEPQNHKAEVYSGSWTATTTTSITIIMVRVGPTNAW